MPSKFFNKKNVKPISQFWKSYFEKITMAFNQVFFNKLRKNISVRFVSRESVTFESYQKEMKPGHLQLFVVSPFNEVGLIYLPSDFMMRATHYLAGGTQKTAKIIRPDNETHQGALDKVFLHSLLIPMLKAMAEASPLKKGQYLEFLMAEDEESDLLKTKINPDDIFSVAQFTVTMEGEDFYFDLLLADHLLSID